MENVSLFFALPSWSRRLPMVVFCLSLFLPQSVFALAVYVNDGSQSSDVYTTAVGNNANSGTKGQPLATLQFALANYAFGNGDTIYVDAGTYTDQMLAITAADAGVVIRGAGRSLTTFDGLNRLNRWMVVSGNNVQLRSMTVRRYGHSTGLAGQALTLQDATGMAVEDVLFEDQGTSGGEATIYIATTTALSTSATITNCVIQNTIGNFGGGIDVCSNTASTVPTLTVTLNNTLIENCGKNSFNGGALLLYKGLSAVAGTQAPVVTANNCVFGSPTRGNSAARGGAIYVDNGATLHLNGACVSNNSATDVAGPDGGGGIYLLDGTVNLTDGMVMNNSATPGTPKYGGGIFVNKLFSGTSTLNIRQSVIAGNQGLDGAGIYLDNSTTTMKNVLLYGNTASDEGGAMTLSDAACNLTMHNCTVASNTTSSGSGTRHGGLQNKQCASAVIKNSIFWGNTRADVSGATNLTVSFSIVDAAGAPTYTDGGSNSTADPLFMDAVNSDYRLLNGTSPAVDTGTLDGGAAPTSDIVNTLRIGLPDRGAYELGATTVLVRDCPNARQVILPVVLTDFGIDCTPSGPAGHWLDTPEGHLAQYWVEASMDGRAFAPVTGSRTADANGDWVTLSLPLTEGHAFYRLAALDADGLHLAYSEVVARPDCGATGHALTVYPSIARDEVAYFTAEVMETDWTLEVLDVAGRVWLHEVHTAGAVAGNLDVLTWPAGTYCVRVQPNGGKAVVRRFVKL